MGAPWAWDAGELGGGDARYGDLDGSPREEESGVAMFVGAGPLAGVGVCNGCGVRLPDPSSSPSPHCVAPAHSCHQNSSLSPPHCGANEFSCEAPQAQHVGQPHPRPRGPGPASEGPLLACLGIHTRRRGGPRRDVLGSRSRPEPGPERATQTVLPSTCAGSLAWGEPAGSHFPVRPAPSLAHI